MSEQNTIGFSNLLKLTPDQFNQILDVFVRMWTDCTLLLENVDEGIGLYTHAPAVDKIKIQGFETKQLVKMLGEIMDAVQTTMGHIKNKNMLESNLKISKQDADRLVSLLDRLEKEGILHDIDYKFNSETPSIDIRSLNYDVKLLSPTHLDEYVYPCCTVTFKIVQGGDKRPINVELTKNEVKKLVREFQNMEKQIEKAEDYLNKVKKQ